MRFAPPTASLRVFMIRLTRFALFAAVLVPLSLPAYQREPGVVLRAVRFYRADQDRTRVKGLVQIPFSLLQPTPGAAGAVHYAISVRVADSSGLTLYQQ